MGADWRTNYMTQVNWGLAYIYSRATPLRRLGRHSGEDVGWCGPTWPCGWTKLAVVGRAFGARSWRRPRAAGPLKVGDGRAARP